MAFRLVLEAPRKSTVLFALNREVNLAVGLCICCLAAGCGARTDIEVFARDDADIVSSDAAADGPTETDCLWHEGVGFLSAPGTLLPREENVKNRHPSVFGHGSVFLMATEEAGNRSELDAVRIDRFDKLGRWSNLVYRFAAGRQPVLIPSSDGERVLLAMYRQQNAYLVEWTVEDLQIQNEVEFEVSSRVFSAGAIEGTHNGQDWVLLMPPNEEGRRIFGAVVWDAASPIEEWGRGVSPGPITSDPTTGRVFVQANDAAATNPVKVFSREAVEIDIINFSSFGAIHWVGEGSMQLGPFLSVGTQGLSVNRHGEDGMEVSGFSAPDFTPFAALRSFAVASGPIGNYPYSYGVLAFRNDGTPPFAFHGAVEDEQRSHVSDLLELNELGPLDSRVSLAAGGCGYLLAWDNSSGSNGEVLATLIYPGRGD